MAVSNSFKALLAISLGLTILPKLLVAGGIANPTDSEITKAMSAFLTTQGYEITSPVTFGSRNGLMAMKGDCLMHVLPVAHQGWHQATLQQSVGPTRKLWFEFEGKLTASEQETYYPLAVYYLRKSARYFGIETNYPPVLAIVTDGTCSVQSIPWNAQPGVPFRTRGLVD